MCKNLLLSSINWNLDDYDEIWFDCGILFPFFQKQNPIDPKNWVDEIIALSKKKKVYTTRKVKQEVANIWATEWKTSVRERLSTMYKKLFQRIYIANIDSLEELPLSSADTSLKNRPSGLLVTSDVALFDKDRGPSMLVRYIDNGMGSPRLDASYKGKRSK